MRHNCLKSFAFETIFYKSGTNLEEGTVRHLPQEGHRPDSDFFQWLKIGDFETILSPNPGNVKHRNFRRKKGKFVIFYLFLFDILM